MMRRICKISCIAILLTTAMTGIYMGWAWPHAWVFTSTCSDTSETSEAFIVVDWNIKVAELRAVEYARRGSNFHKHIDVTATEELGRVPWRRSGVEPIPQASSY